MRTFYCVDDGTTYWKTDAGWMGAPTNHDGTPDIECAGYVTDFDLSAAEIRDLEAYLDGRTRGEPEPPPPEPREWWDATGGVAGSCIV